MKFQQIAMVLTGLGLLSACGAANLPDAGSGAAVPSAEPKDGSAVQPAVHAEGSAQDSEAEEITYSLPDLNSFTARTLDSGSFTAADLDGADLTVINIWSTTCSPCIREMPEIAEFAATLPDSVRLMTWCIDAEYSPDREQIGQFLDDCGFNGITLTSGDGDMQKFQDELMYTPTTVFLDSRGNLLCEPLIGAGDVAEKYTEYINVCLTKLGKNTI